MESKKDKANVFISYSNKDTRYVEEFMRRLNILRRSGVIEEIYSDQKLLVGEEWDKKLWDFLERSNIVVFLLTPEALTSDYIAREIKHALEKYEKEEALVFPVMVQQIDPTATPLSKFKISMPGNKPVAAWENREEAWQLVAEDLKILINRITASAALRRIEEAKTSRSSVLDLGNCGLKDVPHEVLELDWLEGLILGNTKGTEEDEQLRFYREVQKENGSLWPHNWFTQNDGPANNFEHCDFNYITALKNLRFLNIDGCIVDLFKFDFTRFDKLEILLAGNNQEVNRFAFNTISKEDMASKPVYTSSCPVKLLSLSRNNLQQLPPEFFTAISSTIEYLNLSLNPSLDLSYILHTSQCRKLVSLDLEANNLRQLQFPESMGWKETASSLFGNFAQLQWLNLNKTELQGILFLTQLQALQTLYLNENQMGDFIALAGLKNLKKLCLRHNAINSVEPLRSMARLEFLDVSNNYLTDIEPLQNLVNLKFLILSGNKIKNIAGLGRFTQLAELDASKNEISVIKQLVSCKRLRVLNLRENAIEDGEEIKQLVEELPVLETISLESNPVKNIDQNFWQLLRSPREFRQHFRELEEKEQVRNNEVKLILIGNSTAGKSTLRRMLQDKGFADEEGTTHGIMRDEWEINTGNGPLKVHIWDFGGQEYYHETHKLFFSENAVYVLVWERETDRNEVVETQVNANEDGKVVIKNEFIEHYSCDYWLKNIRHFAPNSPVLVVQNKIDKYLKPSTAKPSTNGEITRIRRLPDALLDEHKIADSFDISLKKVEEADEDFLYDYKKFLHVLKKRLIDTAAEFQLEANFYAIKEGILKRKTENKWTRVVFDDFCKGIDPTIDLERLIKYLCSISVILYFGEKDELKDYVIINPVWVSEQIYKVLDKTVLKNSGHFKEEHIKKVLGDSAGEFLALMKQFQIVFKDETIDDYIAPQYLPESNTNRYYNLAKEKLLRRRFVLEFPKFLPKTIMNNILGQYAAKAVEESYYRYGVAFSTDFDSLNILEYDFKYNQINFFSQEDDRYNIRDIFETILSLFDNIRISDATLTSMDKNTEDKLRNEKVIVLLSVDGETFVNWNKLFLQRAQLQENGVLIPERGKEIHAGAFSAFYLPKNELRKTGNETKKNEPVKVFISYAHKDESYKDELVEHLSGLRRQGFIQQWTDRVILAGDKWDDTIKKNLNEAQVILFLVSPSFLASDYIQDNEIRIALERSRPSGSNLVIIPIPVRNCDIESSTLKDFQGAIKDFKPVSSWSNRDDAWIDVVNKLKAVIERKFRSTQPT
jgi:GTPase SAR1 family protein